MRPYKAFYNGKQIDLEAKSSLAARDLAVQEMNVPQKKKHMVTVLLADVVHNQSIL